MPNRFGVFRCVDVIFVNLKTGKPDLYFDTLNFMNTTIEGQTANINGGQGSRRILSWDFGRTIEIQMQNALFNPKSISLISGNPLSNDSIVLDRREVHTVKDTIDGLKISLDKDIEEIVAIYKSITGFQHGEEYFDYIIMPGWYEDTEIDLDYGLPEEWDWLEEDDATLFMNELFNINNVYGNEIVFADNKIIFDNNSDYIFIDQGNMFASLDKFEGEQGYNKYCDFNKDSVVDVNDLTIFNNNEINGYVIVDKNTELLFHDHGNIIYDGEKYYWFIDQNNQNPSPVVNDKVITYYQHEVEQGEANIIVFSSNKFPDYYKIIGNTLLRDENGKDIPCQLVAPKAKLKPNFNLQLDGENPSVFDFGLDVIKDQSDIMLKLIKY